MIVGAIAFCAYATLCSSVDDEESNAFEMWRRLLRLRLWLICALGVWAIVLR